MSGKWEGHSSSHLPTNEPLKRNVLQQWNESSVRIGGPAISPFDI